MMYHRALYITVCLSLFFMQVSIAQNKITRAKQKDNDKYIHIQLGAMRHFIKGENNGGGKHTVVVDISKRWSAEYSFIGINRYGNGIKYLTLGNNSFRAYIDELGANYTLYNFYKLNSEFVFGCGPSVQLMQEYYKPYIATNIRSYGIYIKPQFQSRLGNHFGFQAYMYSNINSYKSFFAIGCSINLFRLTYLL